MESLFVSSASERRLWADDQAGRQAARGSVADEDLVNWWMVSGVGGTTERVTLGPLRCGGLLCLPHKPRVYATTIIIMVLTKSDFFYNPSALFVGQK